jgi:hypothetical protein
MHRVSSFVLCAELASLISLWICSLSALSTPDGHGTPAQQARRGLGRALLLVWFSCAALAAYGGLAVLVVLYKLTQFGSGPDSLHFSAKETAAIGLAGLSGAPLLAGAFFSLAADSRDTALLWCRLSYGVHGAALLGSVALLGWQVLWTLLVAMTPAHLGWAVLISLFPKAPRRPSPVASPPNPDAR